MRDLYVGMPAEIIFHLPSTKTFIFILKIF